MLRHRPSLQSCAPDRPRPVQAAGLRAADLRHPWRHRRRSRQSVLHEAHGRPAVRQGLSVVGAGRRPPSDEFLHRRRHDGRQCARRPGGLALYRARKTCLKQCRAGDQDPPHRRGPRPRDRDARGSPADIGLEGCRPGEVLTTANARRSLPMNTIDLKGRTAIVTGGARGIGFAAAQKMLASGAAVALWDIDATALGKAAASLAKSGRVYTAILDLTAEAEIGKAVEALIRDAGKIDILVNNAGITGGNAPLWELKPDIWRRVIEVNLVAPYLVCRAVVPHMTAAGYGRIVNIASIAGKEGNPNASHYSASKAGLIGLTKSLAKELATTGVLVNAITPAAAKTEMFGQMTKKHIDYMLSKIPMNRFVTVEELAAMIAWLASEDCSFSTGAVFDISGGRAVY